LGLWISNKLVGMMRGKISVVSELSKGTVFIIEIPVEAEGARPSQYFNSKKEDNS
jgi:signal transduction histidine kinase